MPKLATIYTCSNCGAQSPKWSGRCLECGAWGTLQKQTIDAQEQKKSEQQTAPAKITSFSDISAEDQQRIKTNIGEFDRVLGGGIVPGSLVLIGGEPGIGKSTLMLQIAQHLDTLKAKSGLADSENEAAEPLPILYVSGEESARQIKSRLERLKINASNLRFASETNVEKIIGAILDQKLPLVIIDSIQTIHSSEIPSESGNINQIRACAVKLLQTAKENNIAVIITGHITKDGFLAGPKSLEHLVDTVAYLEQQKNKDFTILRTVKNRFGSVDEIGLFAMTNTGFQEIKNPSGIFLDKTQPASGTVVSCIMEGTRPFLIEIQALVSKTVFGYPQRKASGIDLNRLQILIAVLTKRAGLNLMNQDVHINVVGGLKASETALDLAVCAAIISNLTNQILPKDTIVLGEVGLGGEVRPVHKLEQRLSEAAKLEFKKAIIPNVEINSSLNSVKIKNVGELVEYITQN